MVKEVFNATDYQKGSKQMVAKYVGLSGNNFDSFEVEFSINDYSMKSLLKHPNRSTFAINSWLEDVENKKTSENHWVLFGVSGLIDPFNMSPSMREQRLKTMKFRKVNESTFKNLEKYLQTKNTLYFTKARRSSME